jgi:redox-sensing transcriptional repressor
LVSAGVSAIWNFAPVDLKVPDSVILENEHLVDSLMVLAFRLQDKFHR